MPQHSAAPPPPDAEMYRRLVDSVVDYALFMLTPTGEIASWNEGAQRLKGYSADEVLGRHFSLFYPPDAIERGWPAEELRRAVADGRLEDEGWRVRKDGSRFWADVVIAPIHGSDGELLGFSKVTRDLSERRRQEQALQDSERSLRLLIDSVQDYAIFRLDPQGHVASWNGGAQRINGYKARDILGKHFSIFYPPEAVAAGWPQEELRRAAEAGRFEDEGWRVRKDGSRLWANVLITALRDEHGTLVGYAKVTRDLTERRRQEELLKESEENLRLVVEGVRDHAMFLLDASGRVASWNLGAERVLGFRVRHVVGRPVAMLYTVEDRAAGRPEAELASARDTGFYEIDGWRARADGSRFWAHTAYTAVHDHRGGLRGLVAIVRDLSERKRMRELEDEGQRMHRFIALLSHELRNPLAPITNAVRILERSQEPRDIAWCAHLIGRQAAHLTRLVDDLLDVSRITTGKIQIHLAPLELGTLLRLAFEAARAAADAEGHEMALRLPSESVFVNGDATRLTQVVANLLTNALRYTPVPGRIDVALERLGHVATLQVADNGIGMSETLMARAFDPFVQGDAPLERRNAGLGIGLTLVKHVVEHHGGTVAVASAGPGRGTRFTVSLPLLQPAPDAPVAAEELRASSPASPR
jgi:hypothetical protein